jgi:hypothetical protein
VLLHDEVQERTSRVLDFDDCESVRRPDGAPAGAWNSSKAGAPGLTAVAPARVLNA